MLALLFPLVFSVVLLVCVWVFGDVELTVKMVLTFAWVASWSLLFVHPFVLMPINAVMCIMFGATAFGIDFLCQDVT